MLIRARYSLSLALILILMSSVAPALALDASELALVVNRNMPDGLKLAEFYAKARGVPHHIIELDLPTTEQMSFEQYERDVVPPIREFLRLNDPGHHIKCLVTFYGVPFRIGAHVDTPQETREIKDLQAQLQQLGEKITALVDDSEKMAASYDPSFKPVAPATAMAPEAGSPSLTGPRLDELGRRLNHAGKSMMVAITAITAQDAHQKGEKDLIGLVQQFNSPVEINAATTQSAGTAQAVDPVVAAMPLEDRRFDPAAREEIRQRTAKTAGLFGYAKMLLAQIAYLEPEETEAATDSELSLLWVTFYPRPKWQLNALCYRFSAGGPSQLLMVSRLDAPTPDIVRQMILDSVQAQAVGLRGRVVIDARGLPLDGPGGKPDAYAIYDDGMRRLAALIHLKTKLPLTFDDNPDVLPAHSVQDVAVYCGWYSVGRYVPACSFVPGAVGFHTASFEMVSLRDPRNTGWVRGLLNDGIAATLGPVSEPYLQSFPPPDQFFPLLLTGKLTLAEVYWKTELMASWRMCLVGDPLYNPFEKDPAMKVEDLPEPLQNIFTSPAPVRATAATTTRP
jgi:uncharacterized protein (TIGR03790 family)